MFVLCVPFSKTAVLRQREHHFWGFWCSQSSLKFKVFYVFSKDWFWRGLELIFLILSAFGGSTNDEKSCFFRTLMFYKKNMTFWKSCSRLGETLTFEVRGRFWRSPEPTKIEKSELRTPPKSLFLKNTKNHEFQKTLRAPETSKMMLSL